MNTNSENMKMVKFFTVLNAGSQFDDDMVLDIDSSDDELYENNGYGTSKSRVRDLTKFLNWGVRKVLRKIPENSLVSFR